MIVAKVVRIADMEETETRVELAAEAAHAVVRKFFARLYKVVVDGSIPVRLYSDGLIEQSTLNLDDEDDRGRRILLDVQQKITQSMNGDLLNDLCRILREENTKLTNLAKDIQDAYQKELKKKKNESEAQMSGKNELELLKKQLDAFRLTGQMQNPPEGLKSVIERTLQNYIETSLEASVAPQIIKEQLNELCKKHSLISSEMLAWALGEHKNLVKKKSPPTIQGTEVAQVPQEVAATKETDAPLLSPSILYHASLVCQAVNTCVSTKSVHEFLKREGHELHEVSFSLPNDNIDRYLVAICKKEDSQHKDSHSIIYVAFRSKPALKSWLSQHKSFEEGLKDQTQKIPLRFFIEQLLKKNKIVFTGFSYGGMLACCVTSYLWRAGFLLSVALLQKNVTCITFGQPLINIPFVENTLVRFPELEETIHLVLDKQDKVPGLFHYFQVGCILKAQTTLKDQATPLEKTYKTDFKDPFSSEFMRALCDLKDKASKPSYSKAVKSSPSKAKPGDYLSGMMEDLEKLGAREVTHPEVLFGKLYLLIPDESQNIVTITWKGEVTKEEAFKELLHDLLTEKLQEDVFKLHTVEGYKTKIVTAYLRKEQPSALPSPLNKRPLQEVDFLKPRATSAEFHMFPNEHVLVLEGNNLWFCHKVCIGRNENSIIIDSPSNIMRSSIQFNFRPSIKTEKLCENGGVHVTLYSHFVPHTSKMINTKKEPYSFSLRQIQLAKHTPTEIIQLAYCTAMLERPLDPTFTEHSDQPKPSKRYSAVVSFLEEAGKTVPLESVFHVIAHGSEDTALQCGRALKQSEVNFPPSYMMVYSSFQAAQRINSGLTDEEYLEKQKQHMTAQDWELTMPVPLPPPVQLQMAAPLPTQVPAMPPPKSTSTAGSNPGVIPLHPKFSTKQQASKERLYSKVAEKLQVPQGLPSIPNLFPAPYRSDLSATHLKHQSKLGSGPNQDPLFPQATAAVYPFPFPAIPTSPMDSELAAFLKRIAMELDRKARARGNLLQLISNRSIEHFCPFSLDRTALGTTLPSPIQALMTAKRQLSEAASRHAHSDNLQSPLRANAEIVSVVEKIKDSTLKMCSALLAAFMEQQIRIPLIKSDVATAEVLSSAETPVAMGSWAFVSMKLEDIKEIISSTERSKLIVDVGDYIMSVIEQAKKTSSKYGNLTESLPPDINYADKLLFLVCGIKTGKMVTCSTQFISYSLERQLFQLSKQLKFDKTLKEKTFVFNWKDTFEDNALSLVAPSHRPLLARWIKWALLIHDLRETLAEYTCVGIIGLSNSGKSLLINTLFDVGAHVGTTEKKRTVVPFLYNMDGHVDKLDVIDFPGVDDISTVPEVTKLLVNLAQVVIFVVDYRNFGSTASIEWIKRLEKEDIQVLVCLTYGDNLYAEVMKETGNSTSTTTPTTKLAHRIKQELAQAREKVGHHPSRTMNYYCFDLPSNDKSLTTKVLKEVGVYSPKDVGDWLVQTFSDKLAQHDLAEKLKKYFTNRGRVN